MSEKPTMETCDYCGGEVTPTQRRHWGVDGAGHAYPSDCVRHLKAERDALREVLRELVRLKDLHDRIEESKPDLDKFVTADELYQMWKDYRKNKPLAWERARELTKDPKCS